MITQTEAALSYRTLPKKYDCNIFEQKAIEGLVFKNYLYLGSLIMIGTVNLYSSAKFNVAGVCVVKDMLGEKYLTYMVGAQYRGCSWPLGAAVGYIRWWYAGRSGPFPSVQCFLDFQGCYARRLTCPAGSPPLQRSATEQQHLSTKNSRQSLDLFPHLAASIKIQSHSVQPDFKGYSNANFSPNHGSPPFSRASSTFSTWAGSYIVLF